jgi:hypothetical protein
MIASCASAHLTRWGWDSCASKAMQRACAAQSFGVFKRQIEEQPGALGGLAIETLVDRRLRKTQSLGVARKRARGCRGTFARELIEHNIAAAV